MAFLEEKHMKNFADYAREEGREEGVQAAKFEIAKKLLKNGSSIQDVIDCTGLTVEELDSLK